MACINLPSHSACAWIDWRKARGQGSDAVTAAAMSGNVWLSQRGKRLTTSCVPTLGRWNDTGRAPSRRPYTAIALLASTVLIRLLSRQRVCPLASIRGASTGSAATTRGARTQRCTPTGRVASRRRLAVTFCSPH